MRYVPISYKKVYIKFGISSSYSCWVKDAHTDKKTCIYFLWSSIEYYSYVIEVSNHKLLFVFEYKHILHNLFPFLAHSVSYSDIYYPTRVSSFFRSGNPTG